MLQCPKNKHVELINCTLAAQLSAKSCPECQGHWLPAADYEDWQANHPQVEEALPNILEIDFTQSELDSKAGLCPECHRYLSRAKVGLKNPFYIERCTDCGGIWCDRGEWELLEKLGLHASIQQLFSSEWQTKVREREYAIAEQQATIEKLGPELAARVFDLAQMLQDHPNGDFGVAYLMRRFDKPLPGTGNPWQ